MNYRLCFREQYRVPGIAQTLLDELSERNTNCTTLRWTYSLSNGVRFNASYGRNLAQGDNHNILVTHKLSDPKIRTADSTHAAASAARAASF